MKDPDAVRTRARRGQGDRLRGELLEAATKLLDEGGESALKMRAIAIRARVTTPAVYRHFKDKSELVDAVCLRAWADLERQMLDAAAESKDPFQALRCRAAAYVRFALGHAVQYRLLMAPSVNHQRSNSAGDTAARALLDHLVEAVKPCVEAGVFRGDPLQITLGIWAAMHGCVALSMSQPQLPWSGDIEAFAEHVGRMSGLGSALLSRIESLPTPPSSVAYARVFDRAASDLAADVRNAPARGDRRAGHVLAR